MFKKVLIANRGEIAVRVAHTLRTMGVGSVAVYGPHDAQALHVAVADEAYPLDSGANVPYLDQAVILDIASRAGAEAIHPGYGFLSENAEFAAACAARNVTFIGPSVEAIRSMGDKIVAKRIMDEAGVPTVPGHTGHEDEPAEALRAPAAEIGYPVLVKAAAGGGGKGMRVVHDPEDLVAAVEAARREAGSAFGDGRVFLEKYIPSARHVEFQVFGDAHGRVVHLFERDCSIQRRHQKIVEEAPAPGLSDEVRAAMGDAAVRAAAAIGYTNAGTVEFMLEPDGAFYFLEVNTRLQVEHPVTELTINEDLVRAQVLVASGAPMPFGELRQTGHAIECRIYAEDPARGYVPQTGRIEVYEAPAGPGIRVDSGVTEGSEVTMHFDPMLAKLITVGESRDVAIERMLSALDRFIILGVGTNIGFLRRVCAHEAFRRGEVDTHFLARHEVEAPGRPSDEACAVAAITVMQSGVAADRSRGSSSAGPWTLAGAWRNT